MGSVMLRLSLVLALIVISGFADAQEKAIFPIVDPPVEGANFTALAPGFTIPPDTNGAVGPNHLLLATNGTVQVQDRSGATLSSVTLAAFWSGLGVSDVFDPRSIFDPYSQRFIMITCADRRSAASSMLFAISASDDPTGLWHQWQMDLDPGNVDWIDYGNLGFTSREITFTGNRFAIADDSFTGAQIWRIDTASAMDGGALTMESFLATGSGGTLVPTATYDPQVTTQYMVRVGTANIFGTGRIQVLSVGGSIGTSTVNAAPSASVGNAWSISLPDAPQLGSASLIQTNDNRILSAVYQNGRIWACHTVGLPATGANRCAAQWWEVQPVTGLAVQSGVLDDPTGQQFYYYPAITVNDVGFMAMACSGSSATEYVSAYYAWRVPGNPDGSLSGVQRYHSGVGPYSGPRWGDYSGIYLDPVDGQTIWGLQQYAEVGGQWGIQWVRLDINVIVGLAAAHPTGLLVLAFILLMSGTVTLVLWRGKRNSGNLAN